MKKIKYLVLGLAAQFMPLSAFAAVYWDKNTVLAIFEDFVNWFAAIIGILGILIMLWAAFLYMTAGGDEEKVGKAKSTLLYGLLGVAIAILAYGVFGLVESFLVW